MRFKANKMGYSLNQRGLFEGVVRDLQDRRIKINAGGWYSAESAVCTALRTESQAISSRQRRKKKYSRYSV